jgi:hypothetical protein
MLAESLELQDSKNTVSLWQIQWSRILEKLIVAQLVKKLLAFYGTRLEIMKWMVASILWI